MLRTFGHLGGLIADYTVGTVIVMVHIATAEWRQRPASADRPELPRRTARREHRTA